MADEMTADTRVVEVLAKHTADVSSYSGDLHGCEGCDWTPPLGVGGVEWPAFYVHQADMLTEARLLNGGDGHHTLEELYEFRMLYNAHAAHRWAVAGLPVVKSWRHHDGEACFGGGWFIVTATLPTGQVTNHYEEQHWELFVVPAVDRAPDWDGHTAQDAAQRLRAALLTGKEA